MQVIGFDIGGGSLKAVLGDSEGNALHNLTEPVGNETTAEELVGLIAKTAEKLSKKATAKIVGAAVGIPGLLNYRTGRVLRFPNLRKLEGFPLRDELAKKFNMPFHIENDANLAAIGEAWLGAARGLENFILVALGTGVGSAIYLEGKLFRGVNGLAGELGHTKIALEGPECGCGAAGCLETFAGGASIERRIKEAIENKRLTVPENISPSPVWLAERARAGGNAALAIYNHVGRALGRGLGNMTMMMDIESFVFVGGGANALDLIEPHLRKELEATTFGHDISEVKIIKGELGEIAGRMGAVKLVLDNLKS